MCESLDVISKGSVLRIKHFILITQKANYEIKISNINTRLSTNNQKKRRNQVKNEISEKKKSSLSFNRNDYYYEKEEKSLLMQSSNKKKLNKVIKIDSMCQKYFKEKK